LVDGSLQEAEEDFLPNFLPVFLAFVLYCSASPIKYIGEKNLSIATGEKCKSF